MSIFQGRLPFSLLFKSLLEYFLLKVHNDAPSWCHIFTLFCHHRHERVRIRVLVNIFITRSKSLKHIFCCFFKQKKLFIVFLVRPPFWFSKVGLKIMHTENEKPENKQSRMNNPYPPFPTPFPTPYRVRAIIGHFTFFCYKYNVLSFLQVPWSSY